MTAHRRSDALSAALRWRGARFVALVCAALAAAPAAAGDLSGRADLTYGNDEGTSSTNEYVRQVYWLQYRRVFSPALSYRLSLRAQDDQGRSASLGDLSRRESRFVAPSGSLDHHLDTFGLRLAYDLQLGEDFDSGIGRTASRTMQRYRAGSYLKPFESGEVSIYADRLAFEAQRVDTRDDRAGVQLSYRSTEWSITNDNRVQRYVDNRSQLTRLGYGPRSTVQYSRRLGDRFNASAQYIVDFLRTEQQALSSSPVSQAIEVDPVNALYIVDDLPIDTTTPLNPDPRLIDRTFNVSAGISLGPEGSSFQNLALDMGRVLTLDEMRVHVRNGAGGLVSFGGTVTWTVYSSVDGLRWIPVDGVVGAFDPEVSAYIIGFNPTPARLFKIVNFGVNTIETFVTELQSFAHEAFRPNETLTSSTLNQGLQLNVRGTPWTKLNMGYIGQVNGNRIAPLRGDSVWSSDVANTVDVSAGRFGWFSLGANQTQSLARQAAGNSQSSLATSASVSMQPVERYEATLEGRHSRDRVEFSNNYVRTITNGARISHRIDPYDSVRATVSAAYDHQQIVNAGSTQYLSVSSNALLKAWRDLDVELAASYQRPISREGDTSAQDLVPLIRIVAYERYTAEGRWRPSSQLSLSARGGYTAAETGSGVVQNYRANWNPFPGGAIQLSFDYSEDIDPLSGRRFRRASAMPRWLVNRFAAFQLSYNNIRVTANDAPPLNQQNLYLTLSLMF